MDEQQALDRLKTNDNIVILPTEKRRVTVLWTGKITTTKWTLVINKQTYTHRNVNCLNWGKLKESTFDATTDWGLMFSSHLNGMNYRIYTNQAYLCGLFIVSLCGFPLYQLSKYTTKWTYWWNLWHIRIETLTAVYWEPYWRHQDNTDTWRPQTSFFRRGITVYQYSTSTYSGIHWKHDFKRTLRKNYHSLRTQPFPQRLGWLNRYKFYGAA